MASAIHANNAAITGRPFLTRGGADVRYRFEPEGRADVPSCHAKWVELQILLPPQGLLP
jgi:hypothetical protein